MLNLLIYTSINEKRKNYHDEESYSKVFSFRRIDTKDFFDAFKNIFDSSSAGNTGIHLKVLEYISHPFLSIFTKHFNYCVTEIGSLQLLIPYLKINKLVSLIDRPRLVTVSSFQMTNKNSLKNKPGAFKIRKLKNI